MLERDIQLHILKYLASIGAYCGKTKTTGIFDPRRRCFRTDPYLFRGYPDISGFHNRKMFFVEVKAGKNKQSNEQKMFEQYCDEAGITYILAYCLEDVTKVLY